MGYQIMNTTNEIILFSRAKLMLFHEIKKLNINLLKIIEISLN